MRQPPWLLSLMLAVCLLSAALGFHSVARSDDAQGARSRAGRHRSITQGLDCNTCHTTAGWKGMAQAQGARGFDHARTGFPLTGEHTDVACVDCHRGEVAVRRECSACHRDEHAGSLGSECADCHSPESWQSARALELHRATRLPLTGAHALLDCAACHRAPAGARFVSVPSDCYACHEDDFRNPDVHPSHVGTPGDPDARPFPRDCSICHRANAWSPAVVDPATLRGSTSALRAGVGAPDGHDLRFTISWGAHRGAACSDCHSAPETMPRAVRCTGCHAHNPANLATEHRGRLVTTDPRACLSCHPGGQSR